MKRYRPLLAVAVGIVLWMAFGAIAPNGLPVGVAAQGIVLGALNALVAIGIVLIYRASRVINFAQAEIGGLSASVAIVAVTKWEWPYVPAAAVAVVLAVATGWLIDATVVRRFFKAPRLIFTVATIGLAQIFGAAQVALPAIVGGNLNSLSNFAAPFEMSRRIGPIVFGADHLVAALVVPLALVAMSTFFTRADVGVAIRGAADSNERALLLGIPVRRLSRLTWILAAVLSTIGALLAAPILGPQVGAQAGPAALLAPLAAAVIGRMQHLPRTVAAALGIGIFEQLTLWNYPRSAVVDLGLFGVIMMTLLVQRRTYERVAGTGLGSNIAAAPIRAVPDAVRMLPTVRAIRLGLWAAIGLVVVILPIGWSDSRLTTATYVSIYGLLALSLVVLTGWSGQLSLGQFAFAGVGAGTAAALMTSARQDLVIALAAAAAVGAVVALLVGIPAIRIPGPFLAVSTLALGVPVSTFLLNSANFPTLTPSRITRPVFLDRIDLEGRLAFYYFCLASLALGIKVCLNYRRSRIGRATIAVRDNDRAAAAFGISPTRTRLFAFATSGGLAGLAGGLFIVALRTVPFSGFDPVNSLVVFTMVAIGGATSISGGLAGAVYVQLAQTWLTGAAQLLATGAGLLLLLMFLPGGLSEIGVRIRDRVLGTLASRAGVPYATAEVTDCFDSPTPTDGAKQHSSVFDRRGLAIGVSGLGAGYGRLQVLFDVNIVADDGEMLALLGTNGAGKSTVLATIAGTLSPTNGRVIHGGEDITAMSVEQRVRRGIVLVPGGRGVLPSLTVDENLRLAAWLKRHDADFVTRTRARIFELFPVLEERLDSNASLLSGGEQQMLTLAQALLCDPEILMIDELSLGLAPAIVGELLDVVREINASGVTVIVVEQSVNVAMSLAERAVFMEKGQVRFTGPTRDLTERGDLLRSVFLDTSNRDRAQPHRTVPPSGDAAHASMNGHADTKPLLRVEALTRQFGGIVAVNDVSFEVAPNAVLGLIGSNGAGKTTIFDLVSGFLTPTSGTIEFRGEDVTRLGASQRAGRGLGRSFQDARLFPSMTVREVLATAGDRHLSVRDPLAGLIGLHPARRADLAADEITDVLIELLGLGRYADSFTSELSTGTRRILELGCALAHQPSVLLLDEPAAGVAQKEVDALATTLLDIRELLGTAMVVIEHDIPMVSSICDELICLHLGQTLSRGSVDEVLADPQVIASYLGDNDIAIERSGATR